MAIKLTKPKTRKSIMLSFVTNFLLINMSVAKPTKRAKSQNITPALFVFGDSLVDVGNNDYLSLSVIRSNFPHNGIDFPTHKPTGRFSNGKNAADFLAEKLGLPTSSPYLSLIHNESTFESFTGISFASGGAGILDTTNQRFINIPMNKQIENFATLKEMMVQKMGQASYDKMISKSVLLIVIGSNDVMGYFSSFPARQPKKITPQQLVESLIPILNDQLKRIYNLGGRKFVVFGIGPIGCCPSQRQDNKTKACDEEANYWASKFNQGLVSILHQLESNLGDFQYSYIDTYNVLLNVIQQPAAYGFREVKAACCGLGDLNAQVPCLPISSYCPNRSDHVFWDLFHPTEATDRIIIETTFNGPSQYAFPVNVQRLVSS